MSQNNSTERHSG
ncbi:hypothetical protein R3I94_011949 [Phoxinus phoxinus]